MLLEKLGLFIYLLLNQLFLIFYFCYTPDQNSYSRASIDKHSRLMGDSQKIVIVGGSFSAFAVDSKSIESQTKIKTVNMGLNMTHGLRFQLNEINPHIKENDFVFIIPEYENFFESTFKEGKALTSMLIDVPDNFKYLDAYQWLMFFKCFPVEFSKLLRYSVKTKVKKKLQIYKESNSIYNRSLFNEYGDAVINSTMTSIVDASEIAGNYNKNVKKMLNEFILDCKSKNINAFVIYPYIRESQWDLNKLKLEKCNFENKSLPDHYFFDSVYHILPKYKYVVSDKIVTIINQCSQTVKIN